MPVINNGSQHDRIVRLRNKTTYTALLIERQALDDKKIVRTSLSGIEYNTYTSLHNAPLLFTPAELTAIVSNNKTYDTINITPNLTVPNPPTNVTAIVENTQITVSWVPPIFNGGSEIINYTVTSIPGGFTSTVSKEISSARLTVLMDGTTYRFTVVATNAVGSSAPSSLSSYIKTPINIINYETGFFDIFIVKYLANGEAALWAKGIGGSSSDQPVNMVVDSAGNIYVSGNYSFNTLNIPGFTPDTLTNSGSTDTFIVKYLADGTPQWAKSIGGTGNDQPLNMVVDSSGNVYVSGYYNSEIVIDTQPVITFTNSNIIVKYSTAGTPLWAKSIGGSEYDQPVNMVVDSSGNVYVSGYYNSEIIIDTQPAITLTNSGDKDIFIVKYSTDGIPQWAKSIGGSSTDQPVNMVLDSSQNIYISGYYNSEIIIDTQPVSTLTNSNTDNTPDTFIVKYSTAGTPLWAKSIGGSSTDQPVNMVVDSSGNVYVSGYYNSLSLTISPTISLTNSNNNGSFDTFIVKYSTHGIPLWAKSIGGTGYDQPVNMVLDSSQNIYISGKYNSEITIDTQPTSTILTPYGNGDIFIVKYSTAGTPLWAKNINGSEYDQPVNMVVDSSGNVYVSGYYISPTLNIPGFTPDTLTNSGSTDIFILKYSTDGTPQWSKNIIGTGAEQPVNMVVDSAGNICVSGYYASLTLNFSTPSPPTNVTAVAGNAQATVSWTPPSNSGVAITSYTVTSSPGRFTASTPDGTTNAVVTGLTNGTAYTFSVVATNSAGSSIASLSSSSPPVTPYTMPDAPTSVSAVAGNTEATVSWTAPASNGSAITGYTVTSDPAGFTGTANGGETSAVVTGLTAGNTYTFSVVATNAAGNSTASYSPPVTPYTVPDAPTSVTAVAGNAQATVSWTAPVSNGFSAITAYTVTSNPGGLIATANGGETSAVVTGLTAGIAYTFSAVATNAAGNSTASSASSPPVTPYTVPGAPTSVTAVAGNAQASVSWTAPVSDGGLAITGYTVTSSPGGLTATANGGETSAVVTGLTNGIAYTFTVVATNAAGDSTASASSPPVTPYTVPDAPTSVSAVAGNTEATVSWSAPSYNGFSAITAYTVTSNPDGLTATANGGETSAVVAGLMNGTEYTFTVVATNAAGNSTASASSPPVTPT